MGDEVREYIEVTLRFKAPVYVRTCESIDAIYVQSAKKCLRCPAGCVLSSLFNRAPKLPGLSPSQPNCLCGLSYEELDLRAMDRPGDPGVDDVTRADAEVTGMPSVLQAYGTGIWQFDSLLADLNCEKVPGSSEVKLLSIRRYGLNGPPLSEPLHWLRRFDTAFGLDDIDKLHANASRAYDDRLAVFLLPARRTRDGRVRSFGLSTEELLDCGLELPLLAGPREEPVAAISRIRDLAEVSLPCTVAALMDVRQQVTAALSDLPSASRHEGQPCNEDWRTSLPPGGDPPAASWGPDPQIPDDLRRTRRVGLLALRSDFRTPESFGNASMDCASLRWQLRLRATNLRERALAYTALDAVNGCWDLLERLLYFAPRVEEVESDTCRFDSDNPEYWSSPCCNPRLLRGQCCPIQKTTFERQILIGTDANLLAEKCRQDPSGQAGFANSALAAALAWRRRLTAPSGSAGCMKALGKQEEAHADRWRVFTSCHAEVMGRYDREMRMYSGVPCIVDEDCITNHCVKPTLRSLKMPVGLQGLTSDGGPKKHFLGRCRVPTASRHVYLLRCLSQRVGPQLPLLMAKELGLPDWQANEATVASTLPANPRRKTWECIGPLAPRGVPLSQDACLAPQACNWNHEVRTRAECEQNVRDNMQFCGCQEGFCYQQSVAEGCIDGRVVNEHCYEARAILHQDELRCQARADTAAYMLRCSYLAQNHSLMLRACLASYCLPPESRSFSDERCVDLMRNHFSSCHDQCNIPSGPNPSTDRKSCYFEMHPNETEAMCFNMINGDAQVHWAPYPDGSDLSMKYPEGPLPRYCSVRVWKRLQPIQPLRSREEEQLHLEAVEDLAVQAAATASLANEAVARQAEIQALSTPPRLADCGMGYLPMSPASTQACWANLDGCCLSPINTSVALCDACERVNTTVCTVGQPVIARFPANNRFYNAKVTTDLGNDKAQVTWDNGEPGYREVPWEYVFTRDNVSCTAWSDGCSTHRQCGKGQYCYGCQACRIAHGGNPPAELCAPCPTHRGGACGDAKLCQGLQDAIDGVCPADKLPVPCPCKAKWSVRNQYVGAPYLAEILGCFFDAVQGFRWCEVDGGASGTCEANRITGKDRYIYWRKCTPDTCNQCNCDCSPNCMAYDIVPVEGRLPSKVIPGNLTQVLDAKDISPAGTVQPNCRVGSDYRLKGLCAFCVSCCADYCHALAVGSTTNQTGPTNSQAASMSGATTTVVPSWNDLYMTTTTTTALTAALFDCTATNVTGCSDAPVGWMDSVGRSCSDYSNGDLCTLAGDYGPNWKYMPPRSFKDFQRDGKAAVDACCECGGGVGCIESPPNWQDPDGFTCKDYERKSWCNRGGYGHTWDASWGPFPLGTGGVDAITACCPCGGGQPVSLPVPELVLITDELTCEAVWPGRTVFRSPPWISVDEDWCRMLSGICMRKIRAMVILPGETTGVPDDARIYGLCEQREFITGRVPLKEDGEALDSPGRRLAALDRYSGRTLSRLGSALDTFASAVSMDLFGNAARGVCYYRMPDPLGLFGGPNRNDLPPSWLATFDLNPDGTAPVDILAPPTLLFLGWPPEFYNAYPVAGQPPVAVAETSTASGALRGRLAAMGVDLLPRGEFVTRLQSWQNLLDAQICLTQNSSIPGKEFTKYRQDKSWDVAVKGTMETCMRPHCDLDETITSKGDCAALEGCSATCAYCRGSLSRTREQGLCYATLPSDVARCDALGGVVVDDLIFDEHTGLSTHSRVCALPLRPLIFCTAPGEQVRRCAHLDREACEQDPLGKLLGCYIGVGRCRSGQECEQAGRCSDVDLGLGWASPGLCVATPVDDDKVRQRCTSDGLCFLPLNPPFGMEIRMRHGYLDLLGNSPDGAGKSEEPPLREDVAQQLRDAGRLNQQECESLSAMPGHDILWLERSRTGRSCRRWHGCCLARLSGRCELFTGAIVDEQADPSAANVSRASCLQCSGEWIQVFHWEPGQWNNGVMRDSPNKWQQRAWTSANEWANVVDLDVMRQLYENAIESQIGLMRLNAAKCVLEPLLKALETLAATCGDDIPKEEPSDDQVVQTATRAKLPPTSLPLGSVEAPSGVDGSTRLGAVDLAWHAYSTTKTGAITGQSVGFNLTLEPLEFDLGTAATQIALPGRAEYVRTRLAVFALAAVQQATTTLPRQVDQTPAANAPAEGYPAYLINAMIASTNPSAATEQDAAKQQAALLQDEAVRKQQRAELEARTAAEADSTCGLSDASKAVIGAGSMPPVAAVNFPIEAGAAANAVQAVLNATAVHPNLYFEGIPIDDTPCRSTVVNKFGEVTGQLLGDCVTLSATAPLVNSVELCLPVSYPQAIAALDPEPWRDQLVPPAAATSTTTTTTGQQICAMFQPGNATYGYDIPGTWFATSSWQSCQQACSDNLACDVWQFNPGGCYLKRLPAVAFQVDSGRGYSGTRCSSAPPLRYIRFNNTCADPTNQRASVTQANLSASTLAACYAACSGNPQCVAFEFYLREGPIIDDHRTNCLTATYALGQSVNRVPTQGTVGPQFRDATCYIKVATCKADYGTNLGSPVCCGQPETFDTVSHQCPIWAPVCRGYVRKKQWGTCGQKDITVASISQAYEVVTDLASGDLAMLDVDATFMSLGSFIPDNNFVYIRSVSVDKDVPNSVVQFALQLPFAATIFLAYYAGGAANHEARRPWIASQGWGEDTVLAAPVLTVGAVDEIWAKFFYPGVAQVLGNNGTGIGPPLIFVRPESLWPQLGQGPARCSPPETGCPQVQDQAHCQALAVAARHEFYDFDPTRGCCVTTDVCQSPVMEASSTWRSFIRPQCYMVNTRFEPLSMPGQRSTDAVSASACQARCEVVFDCVHFSWSRGTCYLQDARASQVADGFFVTGPPACQVAWCSTFACPSGYIQKSNQEALQCRASACTEADVDTCCDAVPGRVLDFAVRVTVPQAYNVTSPEPLTVGEVPGAIGTAMWSWSSNIEFGRIMGGGVLFQAQGLRASLRRGGGGQQVCARVFQAGATYCPAVRLDKPMYLPLPLGPMALGEPAFDASLVANPPQCKASGQQMPTTQAACAQAARQLNKALVDLAGGDYPSLIGKAAQLPLCWHTTFIGKVVWNAKGTATSKVMSLQGATLSGVCLTRQVCTLDSGDKSLDARCWSAAPMQSGCPALDSLLAAIHKTQRRRSAGTGQADQTNDNSTEGTPVEEVDPLTTTTTPKPEANPYLPLGARTSSAEVMDKLMSRIRATGTTPPPVAVTTPSPSLATCSPGHCISFRDNAFVVEKEASPDCSIQC